MRQYYKKIYWYKKHYKNVIKENELFKVEFTFYTKKEYDDFLNGCLKVGDITCYEINDNIAIPKFKDNYGVFKSEKPSIFWHEYFTDRNFENPYGEKNDFNK